MYPRSSVLNVQPTQVTHGKVVYHITVARWPHQPSMHLAALLDSESAVAVMDKANTKPADLHRYKQHQDDAH